MPMTTKGPAIEFRYYEKPGGDYILPKLGSGWEIHYGEDTGDTLHFHNLFEFGYCYRGAGHLMITEKEYRYKGGCYTAIPANIPHTTVSDPGQICKWEFLFVDLDTFIVEEMRDFRVDTDEILRVVNRHGTMKTMVHHPRLGQLIRMLIEECRAKDAYYEESIKGHLRAVVVELLRLSEERELRKRSTRYEKYIERALDYISRHYQEDIRIEELADASGLSESHFRRAFEESIHMRPVEYLNMTRIDKACELLLREDVAMTDVAHRVGFQTASSFNRNFKRLTGSTPLQWKLRAVREGDMRKTRRVSALKGWEAEDWEGQRGPGKE